MDAVEEVRGGLVVILLTADREKGRVGPVVFCSTTGGSVFGNCKVKRQPEIQACGNKKRTCTEAAPAGARSTVGCDLVFCSVAALAMACFSK